MKITVEKVSNYKEEMIVVINTCLAVLENVNDLDVAYDNVYKEMGDVCFWRVGRGGNHIWVSNDKNERLLLITE